MFLVLKYNRYFEISGIACSNFDLDTSKCSKKKNHMAKQLFAVKKVVSAWKKKPVPSRDSLLNVLRYDVFKCD